MSAPNSSTHPLWDLPPDASTVDASRAFHMMKLGGPWVDEASDPDGTVRSIRDRRSGRVVRVRHTGAGAFGPGGRLLPGPAWDYSAEGRAIGERLEAEAAGDAGPGLSGGAPR